MASALGASGRVATRAECRSLFSEAWRIARAVFRSVCRKVHYGLVALQPRRRERLPEERQERLRGKAAGEIEAPVTAVRLVLRVLEERADGVVGRKRAPAPQRRPCRPHQLELDQDCVGVTART
eukprot:CAMPEP_0184214140 /NCGR_PEP_ID=MMETSP0976-20121227/14506_1 /TAXON_ID=483370 /ORGANISM="non described non described, Strain CCMP2097" /LENGTH=123 /DNA_ID=CAMNT_0026518895 /DNA_START=36 /DNA_END=405 /DNA_ORIENTATION=+